MRRPLIMGNWKLNGNSHMVNKLITDLYKELKNVSKCTVAIAPPEIYLYLAKNIVRNGYIALGAQNVDVNLSGSFTGETSAQMLKDIGVKYVIVGHSERRNYHKESDEFIAKKFAVVKKQGLSPILCIGETKEENENGETEKVCARQIDAVLKTQGASSFEGAIIAYEPIWAVGTGKSATSVQAQKIHKFIRNYISKDCAKVAEKTILQYGGSVDVSNAEELLRQPDIDGLLVGSASLKARNFAEIIKSAEKIQNQ